MKSDEALAAENAVAEKLAAVGADTVRSSTPTQAPLEQTPPDLNPPEPQVEVDAPEPVAEDVQTPPDLNPPEPAQGEDPAIAAYLKKYGGDVNKALQAAVHAQRKLGEQGNELGQQRQENAEYQALIDELSGLRQDLTQQRTAQQANVLPDQATIDWLDQEIATNPASAQTYAVQALNAGQTVLYDRIMRGWYETDPYAATTFSNALRFEQMKQELQASAPVRDENTAMQAALSQTLAEHPEFTQYTDDLATVIERYPAAAIGLTGTAEQKKQAIETLFALAERDTLRSLALTTSGGTPAEAATQAEVAVPATSEAHPDEAPAEPTPLDVWRQQFREEADRMRHGAFVAR